MKITCAIFVVALCAFTASAQQPGSVQMECHDPAANANVLGPNETLVNGMACHVVKQSKAQAAAPVATANAAPSQEVKAASTVPATPAATEAAQPTAPSGPIST